VLKVCAGGPPRSGDFLLSSASSQVKLGSLQQARYDARIDQLRGLQQRFKPYEKM
jgi:predicted Zn-dependent protease